MINFALPGIYNHFDLNRIFLELIHETPEYVNDDFGISAVYGCFPVSIWNGGRKVEGYCSCERMIEEVSFFNSNGISCRFTFTNSLIEEAHLSDHFSNLILLNSNNGLNAVIVCSELLENYIRTTFPNFKIISSTTKCITDFDAFEEECRKNYELVVLDYTLNHSDSILSTAYPHKVEILLNAYCRDNCPERKKHYHALSVGQLAYSQEPSFHDCPFVLEDFYKVKKTRKSFVTVEKIQEFAANGIVNFKIEGRTNSKYDVLESYIYYLIKKEYHEIVRLQVLKRLESL